MSEEAVEILNGCKEGFKKKKGKKIGGGGGRAEEEKICNNAKFKFKGHQMHSQGKMNERNGRIVVF